ncbi:MAG: hypothetical protein IJD04_02515 [Desulfovibrionaceae bacterium]|nr:hypothetical protein [Desulfovibrionaceae bacterium]
MKKTFLLYVIMALSMFIPLGAAADEPQQPIAPLVPTAAQRMTAEINAQMSYVADSASGLSIVVTTPQDLNNFGVSSPLGRQLQEEMSYLLTRSGYQVEELRKGRYVVFDQEQGEFLLTRDTELLQSLRFNTNLIMVGTYTVGPISVRVNMKVLHAPTREVLASSSTTIPMTREIRMLTSNRALENMGRTPSVGTRLPYSGMVNPGMVSQTSPDLRTYIQYY